MIFELKKLRSFSQSLLATVAGSEENILSILKENKMSFRTEKDSMGQVQVPSWALYGAQTQRALENFPISGKAIPPALIRALGWIKQAAAKVNGELGNIAAEISQAIQMAAQEVIENRLDHHFPIDIYQTGSGTSSNMNANEVIAHRAMQLFPHCKNPIHPNDHVNFGQSSNDTFPTALRVAASLEIERHLLPSLQTLQEALWNKGKQYAHVVKTGRTHLMDAMPITFEQQFGGYARQMELGRERLQNALGHLAELPMGGTAVGTGINTSPQFAEKFAQEIARATDFPFLKPKITLKLKPQWMLLWS